jgi:hypothetical protein
MIRACSRCGANMTANRRRRMARSKRFHHASFPRPLPPAPLDPALHRRGGRGGAATAAACAGAAEPWRTQGRRRQGAARACTEAQREHESEQAPSPSRCQTSPRRRRRAAGWTRPGTACQWAHPAQLRVNLAPQLALPAAAGMRSNLAPPRRLDPAHGPGHIARVIHVQFRSIWRY